MLYVYVCGRLHVSSRGPASLCWNLNLLTPAHLESLDMGYLHSEMRNRFRFRGSFQAPLFPVTFKSKSISPAPVVLLMGSNIFSSSVSDERVSRHSLREPVCSLYVRACVGRTHGECEMDESSQHWPKLALHCCVCLEQCFILKTDNITTRKHAHTHTQNSKQARSPGALHCCGACLVLVMCVVWRAVCSPPHAWSGWMKSLSPCRWQRHGSGGGILICQRTIQTALKRLRVMVVRGPC